MNENSIIDALKYQSDERLRIINVCIDIMQRYEKRFMRLEKRVEELEVPPPKFKPLANVTPPSYKMKDYL
jgi:hypothetical protein